MAGSIDGMIVFGGPRVEEEPSMDFQNPGPRKEEEGQAIPMAIVAPLPERERYRAKKPSYNGFWDGTYEIPAPEGGSDGEEDGKKGSGAGSQAIITITRERIELRAEPAIEAGSKAQARGQWKPTPYYTTTKKEDEEAGLAPAKAPKVSTPEERSEAKMEDKKDNPFDLGGTVVKNAIVELEKELAKKEEARELLNQGEEVSPGLVTGRPHELMAELGRLALSRKVWIKENPEQGKEEGGRTKEAARARDLVAWLSAKRKKVQRSIDEIERYRAPGPPPAGPWGLYPSPDEEVDSDGDEVAPRFPMRRETPVEEDRRLKREEAESDEGLFPSLEVKSESDEGLLPSEEVESESDEELLPAEEMDSGSGGEEVPQILVQRKETLEEENRRKGKEAMEKLLAERAERQMEKMRAEDAAVREEYRERNERAWQNGRRKETREEVLAKLAKEREDEMWDEGARRWEACRKAGREKFLLAWRNGKREEVMRHAEAIKRRNQARPLSPCLPNPWRQYPAEEWECPNSPTEEGSTSGSSEPETVVAAGSERPVSPEGDSGVDEEEGEQYPAWMANLDPEGELVKEGEDWGVPAHIVYRPALEETTQEEIHRIWNVAGTQTEGLSEEDAGIIEEIKAVRAQGRTHLDHIRRLEATCAYFERKRQKQEKLKAELERQAGEVIGQGRAIRREVTRLEDNLEDLITRAQHAARQVHVLLAQPDKVWTFEREIIPMD